MTTFRDFQFTAYFDENSNMVLAKRNLKSNEWVVHKTRYKGNTNDAHNTISIAVDGKGYLHVSWDHHDNPLHYAVSKEPLGLSLGEKMKMTGSEEMKVSYPQFYNLPNGNLIFLYRSGQSGSGTLVMNRFDTENRKWTQLHRNLIDGEEQRNAYWQATIDSQGMIHLSWVWRESWDVATNHDLGYALSTDGGRTWEKSNREKYELPITAGTAEYAMKIPQNSNLINQTSMTTDKEGNPYIASYWNQNGTTQFYIVYRENKKWKKEATDFRKSSFHLEGGGTKKIPISRPEILINQQKNKKTAYLLFRDAERKNKISLAYRELKEKGPWKVKDLTNYSVGEWEPNYDMNLFNRSRKLHVFVQKVTQMDGEGLAKESSTPVKILELRKLPNPQ